MSLLRIPKGLLKLLIFLVALVVGLAFAAVRTQGGRDVVAAQIEAAFANAFAGSLEIGRLYGDVLNTVYAVDVKLTDPDGRTVATVDSIVARISLIDALQRNVTIRTAEFIRPMVRVVRSDSATWNIGAVFRSDRPSIGGEADGGSEWRFRSADVRVRDGRIMTVNEGLPIPIIESGRLFDYTNTAYDGIYGRLTVDLGEEQLLIDVANLAARIREPEIELVDFHGQVVATDSTLTLAALSLATRESRIEFSGNARGFNGLQSLTDSLGYETFLSADIDAIRLDSTEITGLFPRVLIPTSSLAARLSGSRADLRLDDFDARIGSNLATGAGSIRDLDDVTEFNLRLNQVVITPDELFRLATRRESEFVRRMPVQNLTADASGSFTLDPSGVFSSLDSRLTFQAESRLGIVDGRVDFSDAIGDTARYTANLNLFDVAVGELAPDIGSGARWTGNLDVAGLGSEFDELDATAALVLNQSAVRGLTYNTIAVRMAALGRTVEVDIDARRPIGGIRLSSLLDFRTPEYKLNLEGGLDRFPLIETVTGASALNRSEFSVDVDVTARGSTIDDLTGFLAVAVDTVTFYTAVDTVGLPSSHHRLNLAHESESTTTLTLAGDVFEGEFEGSYTFSTLGRLSSLWLSAARRTLASQLAKTAHPATTPPEGSDARSEHLADQANAEAYLQRMGFSNGLNFVGRLRINRMMELHRLVGGLPEIASNLAIRTTGRLSPSDINIQLRMEGDSLRGKTIEIDGMRGQLVVAGSYDTMLDEIVSSDLDVQASHVAIGSNQVSNLSVDFGYAKQAGFLTIGSRRSETDSLSVSLDADLRVLPDRNEVVVSDASLRQIGYTWVLQRDAVFDLYGDAVRVSGLTLVNREVSDRDATPQRFTMDGMISGNRADTLHADAQSISLDQISDLLDFRDHLGGQLDATISIAHVLQRPEFVGDVAVRQLSYVYRDIGDVSLTSSYSGQGELIYVDAVVTQPREPARLVKANEARIFGTIAVPGPDSDLQPGALDIRLEAERVDLFFFEVLFPAELENVDGSASGTGRVTGVLSRPIFEADIQIMESSFRSPPFNLFFAVSGPVTVDSLGFHIHDATLTDPTGGRGTFRGDILFNDYRFFSFDLSGEFDDLMIMNVNRSDELPFYGELWVTASATLTGPLQRTQFRSTDVVTSPRSRLFMPVTDDEYLGDQTFIVFTDSTGAYQLDERRTMLDARPATERDFVEGMNMNFNITISPETTVFLVFDALLGDMIQARGSGRVQFLRFEGEYSAFGTFVVSSGDYLFTAGDVFQRRFILDPGGTITWDGDAIDAALDIPATYRTRASLAGLPGQSPEDRVPIRVNMSVSGRLTTPQVALRIALDIDPREGIVIPPGLESALNREDLAAEYATSVLLTNTFLLTSSSEADPTSSADDLFFNSLSHLVSSQLNRFVSQALDLDVNVGVQQGRTDNAYDLVYGFALRLDEQGIVIRGEGLYETTPSTSSAEGLQGQFLVEYRLTPKVRLELFFRRESDLYQAASTLGTSYGAGIVYQTDFANWKSLGGKPEPESEPEQPAAPDQEAERREEEETN